MNFYILTLFPEMVMNGLSTSITGRAIESGKLHIEAINIRDYTQDKHNHVDDYPYGGGAGMVMQAQPVYDAYTALVEKLGRPLQFGQEMMGLDQYQAVLGIIGKYNVPVVMDVDLGHLSPMMPVVCGSMGTLVVDGQDMSLSMEMR